MEKVYDPATGHEVRELSGRFAGTKYLVDAAGIYVSNLVNMDAGVNWDTDSSSGVENSGSVADSSSGASGSSGIMSNTASSQPQTIIQQLDTSGLAQSNAMATGFANAGTLANQNAMTGSLTGIGSDVSQGFVDSELNQSSILANQTAMDVAIADANAALGTANTNIMNLGGDVSTGFADTQTQVGDMQTAVLGNQTSMADTLKTMGDNANTYYGDLSSGQSNITDNIGTVQTGLDTLRKDQDTSNTLADQARAELASTVTGGFDTVTENQGSAEYAATKRSNAVQQQLGAQAGVNTATTFSSAAAQLSQGNAPSQSNSTQDFVNRLASLRNTIQTQGASLDPAVLSEYTTLANGFDAAGKLVPQGVAANGNSIQRGLTQEGMLITNTYNAQNILSSQTSTDIDKLISAIQPVGQFGDLSVGGGIMSAQNGSPYIQ